MPIRITGLNSGLDTDSIVQELVSAYSTKVDKYKKAQTKLEWKQDTWKEMNTKIYNFYSKNLSNMRRSGNFSSKKTTNVSDSTKATVTADSSVTNGTQTLKINKLATAGYLTGTKLTSSSNEKLSSSSTLSELGVQSGTLKFEVGGEEKSVEVKSDMKISDFVSALKEQGINANFDSGQQRFFISSVTSGESSDFNFKAEDEVGLELLSNLGLLSEQNVEKLAKEQAEQQIAKQAEQDVQNSILLKAVDLARKAGAFQDVAEENYNAMTDADKAKLFSSLSETDQATYTASAKKALVQEFDKQNGVDTDKIDYDKEAYIEYRLKDLEKAHYDEVYEKEYKDVYAELLKKNQDTVEGSYAVKSDASNAEIELNGATFTGESNEFSVNGLKITATGVSDLMTITTATDVDGIYNMIKDFFSEYNTLMNSMEASYNADSAKGYEPLTDDEKSEMSDEEVEKWEKKIKDSLLRRDDTLSSVMSTMSMTMSKTYTINGKSYSLSSFGINTAGYFTKAENESYAYHIDGDEDDATSQGNTDKLRAMIEDDPETVTAFFTQLATDVYDSLHAKMESTTLSSAYKVYNDKQMQDEYDDYTDTIKKWEDKLADLEDYYYDKFSAMETALSKLQSQTNSLSSLLGG